MDLDLTDDQELLRETTARFVEESCPLTTVRELAAGDTGVDRDYLRQAGELGWFAMLVREEHGGGSISGSGVLDAAIIAEERGRFVQPGAFVPANVAAFAISEAGTSEVRDEVLPALIAGEKTATWAVTDPTGDWRPDAGVVIGRRGDSVVVSGAKGLVQDAHLADWFLVTAAQEGGGLSQVVVPASAPGVTVTRLDGLDITRRHGSVRFDGVELSASRVIGELGDAAGLLERELQIALALTVAESVGAMDQIFAVTVDYAKARTAFGRPIGSFQAVKHQLADTGLLLEMSKAMAVSAAHAVAAQGIDAGEVASMAKAFVGDCGVDLSQNCFQVFGGIGYTWEHDQHLYLRRLATDQVLYGVPAWHRERICRLHAL